MGRLLQIDPYSSSIALKVIRALRCPQGPGISRITHQGGKESENAYLSCHYVYPLITGLTVATKSLLSNFVKTFHLHFRQTRSDRRQLIPANSPTRRFEWNILNVSMEITNVHTLGNTTLRQLWSMEINVSYSTMRAFGRRNLNSTPSGPLLDRIVQFSNIRGRFRTRS